MMIEEKCSIFKSNKQVGWLFILTVLLIYPLPQVAIDIYLPSWPAMLYKLKGTEVLLQMSLTIYILFLGFAQLIYGPLSDRFGRKITLLIGCTIFLFASVACVFVTSIYQLLFLRALQGMGMGCGFAVASAILADIFDGKRLAQMTSYAAMVFSLSVILAPVMGGYLQHYMGWQANFFVMMIYAIFLLVMIYWFVFETNSNTKQKLLPKKVIKNYFVLLCNFQFLGNVICLSLVYGLMVSFNIVGPFLLQVVLNINEVSYGKLLLLVGLSYFIGATVNGFLLKNFDVHLITMFGLFVIIASSLGLLLAAIAQWFDSVSIIMFTCFSIAGMGLVYPNCFANALSVFEEKGASGAFIGSVILIGVAIIGVVVTRMHVSNEFGLSYIYLTLSILSVVAYSMARMAKNKQKDL